MFSLVDWDRNFFILLIGMANERDRRKWLFFGEEKKRREGYVEDEVDTLFLSIKRFCIFYTPTQNAVLKATSSKKIKSFFKRSSVGLFWPCLSRAYHTFIQLYHIYL